MTTPEDVPPAGPDGSSLTPQEWEAVRRLRESRPVEPDADAAVEPASQPAAVEPARVTRPARASGRTPAAAVVVPAVAALVIAALVAVALLAMSTVRLSQRRAHVANGTAAVAAATSGVATVLSYNYKSLDADFAKAEALLTPAFRTSYVATTAKGVQPLAAKYHAVSTAQASAGGVISNSGARAQVLVFVSQQVTNTQLSAPRLDRSRIVVDLRRLHGRWLIDKLNPV